MVISAPTARPMRGRVSVALASMLLSCGAGSGIAGDGGADATSEGPGQLDDAAPADGADETGAFDATAADIAVDGAGSDAPTLDSEAPVDGAPRPDDASQQSDAPPADDALDGGVPCRQSSDCANVPATFCQKDSCDPSVIGTCAVIPGTRETGYCSPPDGGYSFVCGCDGHTYPYACIAHAEQVNIASQGPCPLPEGGSTCTTNSDCPSATYCKKASCDAATGTCEGEPNFQYCFSQEDGGLACGCDHRQYGSDCEAASYGINVDFEGQCPAPPSGPCTSQADCGGASYASIVFCRPTVCGEPAGICTAIQNACPASSFGDDVCGCDGTSYLNECMSTWSHTGIAYGGPCRSGTIVPCDAGSSCGAGQTCIVDPRAACSGPSCPGVCVTGSGESLGQGLDVDGGVSLNCLNRYTVSVRTLASQSACDGGPCGSCGYSTGLCDAADRTCPGDQYCQVTGCTATGCSTWYCVETINNCVACAYASAASCDASTPCPAGQLCIPAAGCDGGECPGACVVP